jgi:tetratricopeptide (TPR) repeat protein
MVPATVQLHPAERSILGETVGRGIEAAWALFHTADAGRMAAVARTQLYMLRAHHAQLDPDVLPAFYSAAYRLMGATCHRSGLYKEALRAHDKAYLAALDGGDAWNMAECRAWQAYGMQALGRIEDALAMTGSALRLLSERDDRDAVRLRARLLTSAAMNAATLRSEERVAAMLRESELLLDQLPASHEEFDRTAWLESTGVCSLRLGHVELAVDQLGKALEETPEHWVSRHVFATMGLATALACTRDRDGALAAAGGLVPRLQAMRSRELVEHFLRFLHRDLLGSFPSDGPCLALAAEAEESLSAYA